MSDMDEALDRLEAKKAAKAAHLATKPAPIPKKLVTERTPTGLYFVRYEGGGKLPEALEGMFSSIDKLRQLAAIHGKEFVE